MSERMSARDVLAESDAAKKWLISPTRLEGADAFLDALKANGYAVVELPKENTTDSDGYMFFGDGSFAGEVNTYPGSGVVYHGGWEWTVERARGVACQWLAAAATAERDSEGGE